MLQAHAWPNRILRLNHDIKEIYHTINGIKIGQTG